MHINYELSYDKFHEKSDQVYRVVTGDMSDKNGGWVKVSAPMTPRLVEDIPEVIDYARLTKITYNPKITVTYKEKAFNEARFYMADASIFSMFDFHLVSGDKTTVLSDANHVVLSASMSSKYFGKKDPIGESIRVNNQFDFIVTGVFEDLPQNTHLEFDFLTSFDNLERIFPGTSLTSNWGQFNYFSYVLTTKNADISQINSKIQKVNISLENSEEFQLEEINLQAISDIHFQDNQGNIKQAYDAKYLYIYSAIAFGILLISFINFVNLSTAGSTKRVKEVGVRKVIGAHRSELIFQFITESMLISAVSIAISLLIIYFILLPNVNAVLNTNIPFNLYDFGLIGILLSLLLIVGFASGAYIAFFVTSFKPVNALKGNIKIGSKGIGLKNVLIGIQFGISILLILGSIFIYQQLGLLNSKDLGLDKEQVLNISLYDKETKANAELLKNEISLLEGIESVSAASFNPGRANWNQTVWWDGQFEAVSMHIHLVDEAFIKTLSIKLIEGDPEFIALNNSEDKFKYILNESAKDMIGWDNAIGKSFSAFGKNAKSNVMGVVKDFNFMSLHHKVEPSVLVIRKSLKPSQLLVKIKTNDMNKTITLVKSKFGEIVSNAPFEYHFIDEQFEKLYLTETKTGKVISFLTMIGILLASLGLYGLISFSVQERTREMAIRKILGMNLKSILMLLSTGYIKLLVISTLAAIPVLIYLMGVWLENFSYRIHLGISVFIAAFLLVLLIVLITIGIKVIQVQRVNPINGLRYE
jgi:putative ABC transport system permease protein